MCHNCLTPTLSRRRFLSLTAAVTLTTLLNSCQPAEPPASGRLTGHLVTPHPQNNWPTVAGWVTAVDDGYFTLAAPSTFQNIPLAPDVRFYDQNQPAQKKFPLNYKDQLLVWLDPQTNQAIKLQRLPPISDFDGQIPTLNQPTPTGETNTIGSQTRYTRAGWGAAAPDYAIGGESGLYDPNTNPAGWLIYPEPLATQLHTAVIHHSALDFTLGPQEIQALHMRTNSFADIGYHFIIDGLGHIYEGRPLNVRGAHTGGHNTGYIGICLMGNFERIPPIQAQWDTLTQLLLTLKSQYTLTHLGGHRDYQPGITVCPGKRLHPHLPQLALELGLQYDSA